MTTVLPKNVGGRPPAVIDLLTVERAAAIGCPVEDIAALLGIGRRTLYDHMERDPAVADDETSVPQDLPGLPSSPMRDQRSPLASRMGCVIAAPLLPKMLPEVAIIAAIGPTNHLK